MLLSMALEPLSYYKFAAQGCPRRWAEAHFLHEVCDRPQPVKPFRSKLYPQYQISYCSPFKRNAAATRVITGYHRHGGHSASALEYNGLRSSAPLLCLLGCEPTACYSRLVYSAPHRSSHGFLGFSTGTPVRHIVLHKSRHPNSIYALLGLRPISELETLAKDFPTRLHGVSRPLTYLLCFGFMVRLAIVILYYICVVLLIPLAS